ncbi:MAG: alpha/beta hydrolase [Propionibacteriaceae bacterium]|nr:alpha/beta hydrolase [Propionibacteriaceae bacterium]
MIATATLNGFEIAYETYGEPGRPAVFLVHGLGADHTSMAPLAEALADRWFVVAHDAIGHGRSARPEQFTLAEQSRVLADLIAWLGHDRAAVVGESMGSYIAAQAAILAPGRIDPLVLLVTKGHGRTSSVAAFLARKGIDPRTLANEELIEVMDEAVWSPETPPERRLELMEAAPVPVPLAPAELARVNASLADFDLRPDLGQIQARTLVVSGRDDGLNPPELGEEVANLIPGARFVVFEHSGHLLRIEEADRFESLARDFLAG